MEETPHMHSNHTDQQVTIGVQDSLVSHRSIACIHVNGNASLDLDAIGQQTQATYGSAQSVRSISLHSTDRQVSNYAYHLASLHDYLPDPATVTQPSTKSVGPSEQQATYSERQSVSQRCGCMRISMHAPYQEWERGPNAADSDR